MNNQEMNEETFDFKPRASLRKKVMGYYYVMTLAVLWVSFSIYNNHKEEYLRLSKINTFHAKLFTLYEKLDSQSAAFPAAFLALSASTENLEDVTESLNAVQGQFEQTMNEVKQLFASPEAQLVKVDPVRKYAGFDKSLREKNIPDVSKRTAFLKSAEDDYKNILSLKVSAAELQNQAAHLENLKKRLTGKPLTPAGLEEQWQGIMDEEENFHARQASLAETANRTIKSFKKRLAALKEFETAVVNWERKGARWHGWWTDVIAVILLVAAFLLVFIAQMYTDRVYAAPVMSLTKSAQEIATGNLEHRADVKTGDEYEVLANAFNIMTDKLKNIISNQQVQISKLLKVTSSAAQGNLTQFSDIQTQDDFGKLSSSLNTMIENLRAIVDSVESAIQQLIRASQNISASAQTQSTEVSDQSVQITEIASSFQELSATAKSIADSAKKVSETSTKAAEAAQSGELAAAKSIDAMKNINRTFETTAKKISSLQERSKNIGKVVTTIADLAEQINLLALNAAIEAARAGEHGKGFAVVADEVRKLAEKSSGFTEEIKSIITGVREETQSAVMAMEQGTKTMNEGLKLVTLAGEALKEITQLVEDVATHSREILYSTKQQHEGSEQVSTAVSSVSQTMRDIEFQARETTAAAQSLVELAQSLENNVRDIVT